MGGLTVTALIIRFGYRVQAFAWTLLFIFQPISAVFYPLAILPFWLQFIARLFPAAYVFEGMRAVLIEGRLNNYYLLVAFLLNIIYLSLSLFFYKYMFQKAKEKGYLTQFT